jgi:Lipopolysaccharide kinase (Kdo/WaaP) family
MRTVTANEFQDWLAHSEVLEKDSHGVKVLRRDDGRYLKIFRSRRHPLLVRLLPEAQRFAQHAQRLQQMEILTPQILEAVWIDRRNGISACLYHPLQGRTLEQLYHQDPANLERMIPALAQYILRLHRKGIYFRSLHLGNILHATEQPFGLIDFLDIRFKWFPLGPWQVKRNFAHLRSYLQRRRLVAFPLERLIADYEALRTSQGKQP